MEYGKQKTSATALVSSEILQFGALKPPAHHFHIKRGCSGTQAVKLPWHCPLAGSGSLHGSTPRFPAGEPLRKALNAQACSAPQSVTPGSEVLAKGQVRAEKRDTSHPRPHLLSSVSAPALTKDARRRGQQPSRSTPRPRRQASLVPCPRPTPPQRHPSEGPGGSLPTFPGAAAKAAAVAATGPGVASGGKRGATAGRHLPGAS
ncbi:unnamed protein product [Rangifer tarandus platyrhynchus]|uniref:Uncharacterized protein n=1 Tax=Rangifer tarandus platyrhynchus TaxID=3082113 RepID=A0ABN8ZT39_RANTA|nr:unnamed protein product [Rangifer tarandus platyrhynchus]